MGKPTPNSVGRWPCACCGYCTLSAEPGSGSFDICPVCGWEDDPVQFGDPFFLGGANKPSLFEARTCFQHHGYSNEESRILCRRPKPDDEPRHLWPSIERLNESASPIMRELSSAEHPDIFKMADACSSATDLAVFLRTLIADSKRTPSPAHWQNSLGEQFFDGMAAWIDDNTFRDSARREIGPNAYQWFAKALIGGVIYE